MKTHRTLLVITWLLLAVSAHAQQLNVQGGGTRQSGVDFATTAIGDPWDFQQASDYVYMYSEDGNDFSQSSWAAVPSIVNGTLVGVSRTSVPRMQIQFEGIQGAFNLAGRNGITSPIDASRFKRLSFRVKRTVTPSDQFETIEAQWFIFPRSASTVGGLLAYSRVFTDQSVNRWVNQSPPAAQGATDRYHIYKLDLDTQTSTFHYGANWSGIVHGLLIRLGNAPELVGATIEVDWVRLTERGTTTTPLSWGGFSGQVTLTATHAQTGDVVQIFPDDGSNNTTFPGNGNLTWDHGFLPPGTWTITATGGNGTRQQTITIDPAPVINLTEPDVSGGQDFATSTLGDAWDLTNPQDVLRYGRLFQTTGEAFTESGLYAGTTGNDPFVQVVDDWDDTASSALRIDAAKFHRLTFTLEYTDRKDLVAGPALSTYGSVARVAWRRSENNGGPYTVSEDIFHLDGGPTTYSVDLAALQPGVGDPFATLENPVADLWQGSIGNLRIDPHEANVARSFRLAHVKLAADDVPNGNGFFTVRWSAFDATFNAAVPGDLSSATVNIYYDTDTNASGGLTPIATGVAASAGGGVWSVAGLAPGRYYIYVVIADGAGNQQGRYSTGPVFVASTFAPQTDNDANGMGDGWEALHGVTSGAAGDPDGDAVNNLAEFYNATNPNVANTWHLSEGATGFFRERIALANPDAAPADINIAFLRDSGPPIFRTYTVDGFGRLTVNVNEIAGLGSTAVSAIVSTSTGAVVVERTMFWDDRLYGGHTGGAVKQAARQWYLAEGEASFFDTYILLANANSTPAAVTVTYLLQSGSPVTAVYSVPAASRFTIWANQVAGVAGNAFSTSVASDIPITVERAMYFSTGGLQWNGGTNAAAIQGPSQSWFVAEGRTGPFFDTFLLLANANPNPGQATVRFLLPGGAVVPKVVDLPANSRTTLWVDNELGGADTDVSASIEATVPIIVERAMYWPGGAGTWHEAHNSVGVTTTGVRWALAEGEQGGGSAFETYILFANPGGADASVRLTFLRASGGPVSVDLAVPANSRVTHSAGEYGIGGRFGIVVDSLNNVPIVVERAMYWDAIGQHWAGGTNETAVKLR